MNTKINLLPYYLDILTQTKLGLKNTYRELILSITQKPFLDIGFKLRLSLEGAFKIFTALLLSPILLANIATAYCLDYLTPKISNDAFILKTTVNLIKSLINLALLLSSLWGYIAYALPFVAQTLSPSLGIAGTAGSYMIYGCSLLLLAILYSPGTEDNSYYFGHEAHKIEFMKEHMELFKQQSRRAFQFFMHSSMTRLLGSLLIAPFTILFSLTVLGRLMYLGAERTGIITKSDVETQKEQNILDDNPTETVNLAPVSETCLFSFNTPDDKKEERDAPPLCHPERSRGISLNNI
jgi:hypothetical protein